MDAQRAAEQRASEAAAHNKSSASRVISALIPELVSAARELGIRPQKDGLLSRGYWSVTAGGTWNDEWMRWDGGVRLRVYTDGSWAASDLEWEYLRGPITEESVRATFTSFLSSEAAKRRR